MQHSPPNYPLRFLRWFCREDYIDEIEGDLMELFEKRVEVSPAKARMRFVWDVVKSFRLRNVRSFNSSQNSNYMSILTHTLKLAFRNSKKHKSTFLINITGLSTGLACFLLITLWVLSELTVDKFHKNDQRLYQVMKNSRSPQGLQTVDTSPALLAGALLQEAPEVVSAVTVHNRFGSVGILSNGDNRIEGKGLCASSDFFKAFSYRLLRGDSNHVLTNPNAIVLSQAMATALFGTSDEAVGKVVKGNGDLLNESFIVSGVFEKPPYNSTMQFDFVINFDLAFSRFSWLNEWSADDAKTYVVLKDGANTRQFDEKLKGFLSAKPGRKNNQLFLQRYSDRYLYGQYENGQPAGGRIPYVWLFSIAGTLILLIACINFVNLSTAQASRKMKEVGVKKTLGISRGVLAAQFLGESMFITFFSVVVALLLFFLLLPEVNDITGKNLFLALTEDFAYYLVIFTVVIGIVSGIYPAVFLSGFDPVAVLKGKLPSSFSELIVRRGLVVFQFTLSVAFIIGFLIIGRQIDFVQNANLGYHKENIIHLILRGDYNRETFLAALKNIPGVINATNTHGGSIVQMKGSGNGFSWGGGISDEEIKFRRPQVGYDFVETLGIGLVAGRTFSRDFAEETKALMVNEAAAEIIGSENIIGKSIMDGATEKRIIGVVKNFYIQSLHEQLQPSIIRFLPGGSDFMVRLKPGNERATIEKIKQLYSEFNAEYPFDFKFIDDEYQALYISEQRVATLSGYFTLIAIVISCLGLLGLATFSAERRIKEIAIRKILGSSVFQIVYTLSASFSKLVLIAIVIAIPISFFIASAWLDNFAYHIDLEWWYFASAGAFAFFAAWGVIGWRTFKAASVNPAQCLKYE